MNDCLFCKIIHGQIPASMIFEDDQVVVFKDIHPKAPVHVLVVPRKHIVSLAEATPEDAPLLSHLLLLLPKLASSLGLPQGFRTAIHTGPGGGQEVPHLHVHLLGG